MTESGLLSAGGPLPLTQAVPGNLSTGPCGPGGAPYGRTEYGRSRGARHRISGGMEGVNTSFPVSTVGGLTPVFLSQQLSLKADLCTNVNP